MINHRNQVAVASVLLMLAACSVPKGSDSSGNAAAQKGTAATRGPKGLSSDEYLAIQKGVAAVRRAYEYRDADVLIFDPRMLDAERAYDEAKAADANNTHDYVAVFMLKNSIQDLGLYRRNLDGLSRLEVGPEFKRLRASRIKSAQDISSMIEKCMADIQSYL